jgi:CRISPR-associated protein Cas1
VSILNGALAIWNEAAESKEERKTLVAIPHQQIMCLLLGPGSSITHEAIRICAAHGTHVLFTGTHGVRLYAALPITDRDSHVARMHAIAWANKEERLRIAKKMFCMRFHEPFVGDNLESLRGKEGARIKESYKIIAKQCGIEWTGRHYDRENPDNTDHVNACLNMSSSCMEHIASVAVAALGAIPSLGFIHEDPGHSFTLDISDLFRVSHVIPIAFSVAKKNMSSQESEREIRRTYAQAAFHGGLFESVMDSMEQVFSGDEP